MSASERLAALTEHVAQQLSLLADEITILEAELESYADEIVSLENLCERNQQEWQRDMVSKRKKRTERV